MRTRSAKAQQTEGLRHLTCAQDLSSTHIGAIWTMKMSTCGRLLATAGQDKIVRVWVVKSSYECVTSPPPPPPPPPPQPSWLGP